MINPELPMYDVDGREWVALRMPDGSVWRSVNRHFHACTLEHGSELCGFFPDGVSTVNATRRFVLSNTKPQKDWEWEQDIWSRTQGVSDANHVRIRAGYRNGVAFAQVVE